MADRFFGVVVGGMQPTDVLESGSTTSRAVELRISDTAYTSKIQVIQALIALEKYLQIKETTPIA